MLCSVCVFITNNASYTITNLDVALLNGILIVTSRFVLMRYMSSKEHSCFICVMPQTWLTQLILKF